MPPLIRDYLEFRKIDYLPTVTSANLDECLRTFLPTDSLLELLARILDAVFNKLGNQPVKSTEPTSILLTGGHGVGKSHLLSVIRGLVRQEGSLPAGIDNRRVQSYVTSLHDLSPLVIWLDLCDQTECPLPELVLTKIYEEYENCSYKQVIDQSSIPGISTIKAHELITFNVAKERPILLMIDGLSKRALKRDAQQLNEDIEFLSFIGYSSKSTRLFLIVAAHEDFFSPKSPLGIDRTLMAQTLENFKIEWIDRANLKEIICRHVLRKNPRQQRDLKKLYSFIKTKLPNFQHSEGDFFDAYPYHPIIFDLSDKIKSKVPNFSLLEYVITTYPKIATRRAVSLVAIDSLFDRLEYEIKNNPNRQRLYSVYRKLAEQAVIHLEERWRLWGKMLLKATFLFTLADKTPSVRDLTDSLLLFEDSETGLSYNVVGMLLGQMEKAVECGFTTTDDRLDRTFRLGIADVREELNSFLMNIAAQIPDSDPRLGEILLEAAGKYFPDWPLHPDHRVTSPEQTQVHVSWRGTVRAGLLLYSHRSPERKYPICNDQEEDSFLSHQLPASPDGTQEGDDPSTAEPRKPGNSNTSMQAIEWLVWMEPIGLTPAEEEATKPRKLTEVHWLPSPPLTEEMNQLKKVLALQLTERSANTDFAASDLHSLRDELDLDLGHLFRELYLHRGKIITSSQVQALNQNHLECQTFQAFLDYLLKPNFDQLYPLHPGFEGEHLAENHVSTLTRKLFAGQDPTDGEVQRLAGQFASPLGLVSRSEGLYELNLSITPPIFLTQVTQYLERLDTAERPIEFIFERVRKPPLGLTRPSVHLILTALIADGQIELFNPDTNATISRENLSTLESIHAFPCFKRIQIHKDFPIEVLTQWCRLISGKQDLSDISTSRGRSAATAALKEWLCDWRELNFSGRLESLPNEFLTTQLWRELAWTKSRFEKLAETVRAVLENEITLVEGMGRVIEQFSENVGLLEKASRSLVELSHFIHWLDHFLDARDYLLASEKTESLEIEEQRQTLLRSIEAIHELIGTERANQFESMFSNFKERYIDYYATRHEHSVGPLGNFHLLNELETSKDFRTLQLLASLPLGDSSYLQHLDEWINAFRDYRCSLPARDLLQKMPFCDCTFKLCRVVDMAQIVEDLRSFLALGISHHRQALNYFRHIIEPTLVDEHGAPVKHANVIRCLLEEGPLPELNEEVIEHLSSMIEANTSYEKLSSPLPIIAPTGRITRKELEDRIQKWLESLSDQEDVLFSLKD